ncbi:amino acid permease [Streptosporangium sp. NPDC051023]|uniref:amino acid permease n=1 Tax=Streptosporangium sp. NPDC051023 TaxID=3155410 RepID=UPI00344B658E
MVFASVHSTRATPWVAILFTTAIAAVLVATGDVGALADTTVLLLLLVFALVNVAVLVPRKDPVDHDHYRAPGWMPALGAVVCLVLALPVTGRGADVYVRAGVLLAVGVVLWFVNRLFLSERKRPS